MRRNLPFTKRGFALILTPALLSFLLLLVATLATSLKIETQSSINNTQWNTARQNALMSLNIGLGQLQELAGPDQRVTATGGIVSGKYNLPPGKEYWTGIWNSANGNFEGWLTSDSLENESEATINQAVSDPGPNSDSVWLVNHAVDTGTASDENRRIALSKQPIRSTGIPGFQENQNMVTGNFAYWVSDEGVKASALKTDTPLPGSLSTLEQTRTRQLANRKTDLDLLFNQVDYDDQETRDQLAQSFSFQQLEAIDGISPKGLAETFHELTSVSLGVLANTLDGSTGGLRQDLSNPDSVSKGSIPVNGAVRDFLNYRPNERDQLELQGSNGFSGGPDFSIPVVATEFALRMGFSLPSGNTGPIKIHLALRTDLWNPFSLPIAATPRDTPDLKMNITGLPTLTIEYRTTDGLLRDVYTLNLQLAEIDEQEIDLFTEMAPGQVRNIWEYYESEATTQFIDATPNDQDDDRFIISSPATNLGIQLATLNGELLQEFVEIPFAELLTEDLVFPHFDEDDNFQESDMPLRYWFRFYDEPYALDGNDRSDLEGWSTDLDPRGPSFNFNNSLVSSLIEVGEDPYSGPIVDDFNARPEFFYGGGRGSSGNNYHRFFDVPTVASLSVTALRHLNLLATGPNYLGNPQASLENRVFDEWFCSSGSGSQAQISQQAADAEGYYKRPFSNPHTALLDTVSSNSLNSSELARQTLLFGAFNINCTNSITWKQMLSGNSIEDWEFRLFYPGVSPIPRDLLENPFYRLPFGADRHYKYPTDEYRNYPETYNKDWWKSEWTPDWATSYTVGMREFTDEEIEELAEKIVEVILEQQEPATSVSDFLNKGILQQAIDRTDINTINGAEYRNAARTNRIPLNAPAFLNQADILNTIAPFIQARSDTFRIRAYGDAVNPVTGRVEGRAWCEAWVQRYPELVDPSGDVTASATGLGRKFKIVHFKWLDESQI
ncbi:MAG: hypothetical protein KJT03_05675 [Verrucomicrobiae bacterium]|nr:hypothetical protein [Verrucomicrobiae bacterium]